MKRKLASVDFSLRLVIHFMLSVVRKQRHNSRIYLLFISVSIFLSLTGCTCKCCSDPYLGPQVTSVYKYQLRLIDSFDVFRQIVYKDKGILYSSDTNIVEWKMFLNPLNTTVYIESSKGWDTLDYKIEESKAVYTDNDCEPESFSVSLTGPTIISHSFDSVYPIEIKNKAINNDIVITRILMLKN